MLIKHDGIAIRVDERDAGGPAWRVLRRIAGELDAVLYQGVANGAHVVEALEGVALGIPTGVEGEDVALEHLLEETNGGRAVAKDLVVLPVAGNHF